ncbi:MAG: hypothetical protein R2742_09695 [Micropruina glycogenica]
MTDAVEVQAIVVPHAPVLEAAHAPHVDHVGAVPAGDRPHRRIEHAGAAAGELEHGGVFGVDAGAQNHVDVRLAQPNDGPLEFVGDGVDVDPGAHDVIAAAPQADHVGF